MDKYIRSYMIACCFSIVAFGIGVLVTGSMSMPLKLIIGIGLIVFGLVGFYFLLYTDKLRFKSLETQKMPAALILRSGIMAGGCIYMIWQLYTLIGFNNPLTVFSTAMAVSFAALLPYHAWLYFQQSTKQ